MPSNQRTEAGPAELPKAQRIRWWLCAGFMLLVTLGLVTVPHNAKIRSFLPLLKDITFATPSQITWAILQPVVIAVAGICTLFFIGKARLEGAAYRADRVDIPLFKDERKLGTKDLELFSAAELTAHFKRILQTSRLYTPSALPGTSPSYDFIQIVEDAGDAGAGWWKVASKLIRLAQPPAAFQIKGTIRTDDQNEHRLVLDVVRVPRFAASPIVIADADWLHVLHQAANSVAAVVLPRSRYGKKNIYWASWRGWKIPEALFDAYQHANHLVAQRRYDEALAEYDRALDHDPTNVYLRLEIAAVQEQLDLHLDALITYDDVITICCRGYPKLEWWVPLQDYTHRMFRPSARRTRRQQDVALLVARYRHALVLGVGEMVASTWWPDLAKNQVDRHNDARVSQRAALRVALRNRFHERYPIGLRRPNEPDERTETAEKILVDVNEFDRAPAAREKAERMRMRSYLCAVAEYELAQLLEDCLRFRRVHWIRWGRLSRLLSMRALRLCLVWIVLRRRLADRDKHWAVTPATARPATQRLPLTKVFEKIKPWPPTAEEVCEAVEHCMSDRTIRRTWSGYYNAACVYAVAMIGREHEDANGPRPKPTAEQKANDLDRNILAEYAVAKLSRATAVNAGIADSSWSLDSGRLSTHRAWVLEEDPDLVELRDHDLFRIFETIVFAVERSSSARPSRPHVWEQVSYVQRLVVDIAKCRAYFWRDPRRELESRDDTKVDSWRRADGEVWQQLRELAVSRQDWRTRCRTILAYRRCAAEAKQPIVVSGYPRYSNEQLSTQYRSHTDDPAQLNDIARIDCVSRKYVDLCDERLDELGRHAEILRKLEQPKRGVTRWMEFDHRARRWDALSVWFDDCSMYDDPPQKRRDAFVKLVPDPESLSVRNRQPYRSRSIEPSPSSSGSSGNGAGGSGSGNLS